MQPVGRRVSVQWPTRRPGTSVSEPALVCASSCGSRTPRRYAAPATVDANARRVSFMGALGRLPVTAPVAGFHLHRVPRAERGVRDVRRARRVMGDADVRVRRLAAPDAVEPVLQVRQRAVAARPDVDLRLRRVRARRRRRHRRDRTRAAPGRSSAFRCSPRNSRPPSSTLLT